MTWPAELLHLFRRDLRRTMWPLLLYVAVLTLAVAKAAEMRGVMVGATAPVGQLVMLLAPLLVAMTILADSATRVDAFWAVQPLRTSVVIASKLLYIALVSALCTAAVFVALTQWQLQATPASVVATVVLAMLILVLLGTAVVTAACASHAMVGLVLCAAFALTVVGALRLTSVLRELPLSVWWAATLLLTIGAAAFLATSYRQRRWSGTKRAAAMISGVAVILFAALTSDTRAPHSTLLMTDSASSRVVLRVALSTQPGCTNDRLTVPLEIAAPTSWRVELMHPDVAVTLMDGSRVTLESERWMAAVGVWGPMLPETGAPVIDDGSAVTAQTRVRRTDIEFEMPRGMSARVCGRVEHVDLRVHMRTASASELMRVPLTGARTIAAPGYRARVDAVNIADSDLTISARVSMLTGTTEDRRMDLDGLDYALLHPGRGDVVRLHDDDDDRRSNTNVLPGLRHMSNQLRLQIYRSDTVRPRDLRSWGDSAVLLVIAPVWHSSETRSVRAAVATTNSATTLGAQLR